MSQFDGFSKRTPLILVWALLLLTACAPSPALSPRSSTPAAPNVLVVETFLADITRQVAGDRLTVDTLMPLGVDPHSFEPTPADVAKVSASTVLVTNGVGLEAFLDKLLQNADGKRVVIEAANGLTPRTPTATEEAHDSAEPEHEEGDPHFWLDPVLVMRYVENIRDGLSQVDPDGALLYAANAAAYVTQLQALDAWIREQTNQVPIAQRQLVTNHESLGYFADRYGFQIIGAIVPSVSSGASPSAQQLAALVDQIKATGARAIFLETGANPQLAEQVAAETGASVVTGQLSHSLSAPGGEGATYIEMMKHNTRTIVAALK